MSTPFSIEQLSIWINCSLKNQDIENYKFDMAESTLKVEGYAAHIIFVKITGTRKTNGENVELNLALKVGKDDTVPGIVDLAKVYRKEIFVYDKIFPEYRKFAESKKIRNVFNSIPKCYKTFDEERRILVFENLRSQGYKENNRQLPMNVDQIKIALQSYAQLHSIGLAFKDQKPSDFKNLTKDISCGYKIMLGSPYRTMFQVKTTGARNAIATVDEDTAKKMDVFLEKGIGNILDEILDKPIEEAVVTHGDCWNCNFLFKYENGNNECPTKVAILDWQLASFLSPVMDVAYFMFNVSSKDQVPEFHTLIEYYYQNLSKNILELGSDPNKLLSHSKFLEHWKYYSTAGYLFAMSFLEMTLCDTNEAPDLDGVRNEEDFMKVTANITAKNKAMHLERVWALSKYYFHLHENEFSNKDM